MPSPTLTSPLELIEVRLALEPHMTRLALLNATARDIDRLAALSDRSSQSGTDLEAFTRWDERFHLAIAERTRNPLHGVALSPDQRGARAQAMERGKDKVLTAVRIADYNQEHRALYEAMQPRRRGRGRAHQSSSRRGATGPPRRAVDVKAGPNRVRLDCSSKSRQRRLAAIESDPIC